MEMLRAKTGSQIYYITLLPGFIILISLHSWAVHMTKSALFIHYGEDEFIQKSAQCTIKSKKFHVNG